MSLLSSLISLPKLGIIPLEGDYKGIPIMTMFNPTELNFKKSAGWDTEKAGAGTDFPKPQFTAGSPVKLTLTFYFDYYESNIDVRGITTMMVHLCEAQDCKNDEGKVEHRPPRCQLVWSDPNPLMLSQTYFCVIDEADVTFEMFNEHGVPVRARVNVTTTQCNPFDVKGDKKDQEETVIATAGLTVAYLESIGARAMIEKDGGKIEDPSTWPATITIKLKK